MKDELQSYVAEMEADLKLLTDQYPHKELAFTANIISQISEMTNLDEYHIIHYFHQDVAKRVIGEIHGYSFNENKELLIYTIYNPLAFQGVKTLLDSDYQTALNRLQGFYQTAIRGLHFDLEDDGRKEKPIYDAARKIYETIKDDTVNARTLSESLGTSIITIKFDLAAMQSVGITKRFGSDKTGHLEIVC